MKWIKKFNESEIWNGAGLHYNGLKPVSNKILDDKTLFSFKCNACFFEFTSYNNKQCYCNVCGSEDIEKSL